MRNWPPALPEWSTKAVRDAFFASPKFPRLLNANSVRQTVCRGVDGGMMAYVSKKADGTYDTFQFRVGLMESEVELADDVFVIRKEDAEAYVEKQKPRQPGLTGAPSPEGHPPAGGFVHDIGPPGGTAPSPDPAPGSAVEPAGAETVVGFGWTGAIAPQKWMIFYTKVLARFATTSGLKLTLNVDVAPDGGVSKSKLDEVRGALRELGMSEDLKVHDGRKSRD